MSKFVNKASILSTEKRRDPTKYYVYAIKSVWNDGNISLIYRRYSEFFEMHCEMIKEYPELAAGKIRMLPTLPNNRVFGRSHVKKVAEERIAPLNDYLASLIALDEKYLTCATLIDWFTVTDDDLKCAKGGGPKKGKNEAGEIGGPVKLQEYIVVEDYKSTEKDGIKLEEGMIVEVIEKNNTGWWFVSCEAGQGWVPATFLEPEDFEESTGDEETICEPDNFHISTKSFKGTNSDEVSFDKGVITTVLIVNLNGWWWVSLGSKKGWAPSAYLAKVEGLTADDLKDQAVVAKAVAAVADTEPDQSATTLNVVKEPPKRSNTHRRTGTTRARASIRNTSRGRSRGPGSKLGATIEEVYEEPEGDAYIVTESYTASGTGQVSLEAGERVIVTNTNNPDWWYVNKEGCQGWFPSSMLVSEAAAQKPEDFVLVSDYDASSMEELEAKKGQVVTITDQTTNPDWWFGIVKGGGREGWIPASFLTKA